MMWRDLHIDVWPNGSLIEHALLVTLLGEGGEFENGPPIVADDEPIDHRIGNDCPLTWSMNGSERPS
jgi:hypothetical protein